MHPDDKVRVAWVREGDPTVIITNLTFTESLEFVPERLKQFVGVEFEEPLTSDQRDRLQAAMSKYDEGTLLLDPNNPYMFVWEKPIIEIEKDEVKVVPTLVDERGNPVKA